MAFALKHGRRCFAASSDAAVHRQVKTQKSSGVRHRITQHRDRHDQRKTRPNVIRATLLLSDNAPDIFQVILIERLRMPGDGPNNRDRSLPDRSEAMAAPHDGNGWPMGGRNTGRRLASAITCKERARRAPMRFAPSELVVSEASFQLSS